MVGARKSSIGAFVVFGLANVVRTVPVVASREEVHLQDDIDHAFRLALVARPAGVGLRLSVREQPAFDRMFERCTEGDAPLTPGRPP